MEDEWECRMDMDMEDLEQCRQQIDADFDMEFLDLSEEEEFVPEHTSGVFDSSLKANTERDCVQNAAVTDFDSFWFSACGAVECDFKEVKNLDTNDANEMAILVSKRDKETVAGPSRKSDLPPPLLLDVSKIKQEFPSTSAASSVSDRTLNISDLSPPVPLLDVSKIKQEFPSTSTTSSVINHTVKTSHKLVKPKLEPDENVLGCKKMGRTCNPFYPTDGELRELASHDKETVYHPSTKFELDDFKLITPCISDGPRIAEVTAKSVVCPDERVTIMRMPRTTADSGTQYRCQTQIRHNQMVFRTVYLEKRNARLKGELNHLIQTWRNHVCTNLSSIGQATTMQNK